LPSGINVSWITLKTIFMKKLFTVKSLVLIAVLAIAVACNSTGKKAGKNTDSTTVTGVEVSIGGMTCGGCEQTIQTNVAKLEGIKSVKAFSTMGKAFIEYSPALTDTAKIRAAITGSGYTVNRFSAAASADPSK
jgi:copper chaperone